MLNSADSAGGDEDEWIDAELCVDTRACGTVMPRAMCRGIPIQPSLQSLGWEHNPEPRRAALHHVDGWCDRSEADQPAGCRSSQGSAELEQVRGHGLREPVRESRLGPHRRGIRGGHPAAAQGEFVFSQVLA